MATIPTSSDVAQARAELERRALRITKAGPSDLMDWIPWAMPGAKRPEHLRPLVDILNAARKSEVRAVLSIPPRHAKTTTVLAWCVQSLLRDPSLTISYVSYADDFAASKCLEAKRLAQSVGLEIAGRDREDYWETPGGGLMRSAGIRGQHAGAGYRVIIIDDAHKNREEAESPTTRDKVISAFSSDLQTRRDPRGTSIVVIGARWVPGDLPGWIVDQLGWPYITMPALRDDGTALWPELWPVDKLEDIRKGMTAYAWEGLYQCRPVPRGGQAFGEPTWCSRSDIPTSGVRYFAGYDLAYSAKTHADSSALVVLARRGDDCWVADVLKMQSDASRFAEMAKERLQTWGNPVGLWRTSTTEKGVADLMRQMGLRIVAKLATGDKFVRSQAAQAAWQAGRIQVPRDAPWAADFVSEVTRFTGLGDSHDDQVDALAAAFEQSRQTARIF